MDALTIAQQNSQRDQTEEYQQAQQDRMMGLGAVGGYGNGSPQYGGAMPKRDYGFEEYLSHVLGSTRYADASYKAMDGPYAGLKRDQIEQKARDDYGQMSPEDRAPWENRSHMHDVRSPGELKTQGFEYQDQTDQWGNKGKLYSDPSNPQYGAGTNQSAQRSTGPSAQSFAASVGSMNATGDGRGAQHHSTDDLLGSAPQLPNPSNVVPHPEMVVQPAGGVSSESPGVQQRTGQTPSLLSQQPMVPDRNFSSTNPDFRKATGMDAPARPMGDPNNTAQYGPRYTGSGSLNQVDTAARNEMATKAFDAAAPKPTPGPAVAPDYAKPASAAPGAFQNVQPGPIGSLGPQSMPDIGATVPPSATANTAAVSAPSFTPVPQPVPSLATQVGQGLGSVPGRVSTGVQNTTNAVGTEVGREASEVGQTAEQIAEAARKKAAAGIASARNAVGSTIGAPIENATANVVGAATDFTKGLSQGMKQAPTYSAPPMPSSNPTAPPAYAAVR